MAASVIRHTPDKQALSDVGKRKLTPVEPNKSLLALHANRSSQNKIVPSNTII